MREKRVRTGKLIPQSLNFYLVDKCYNYDIILLMKKLVNLSKFFYDIAKLTFGGFIISSVISKEIVNPLLITAGFGITCILVIIAFWLDKEGVNMWYNLIMVALGGALMAIGFAIYVYYQEHKKHKQHLPVERQG